MTQKVALAMAVAAAGLLVPSTGVAGDKGKAKSADSQHFVMETARSNMAEIQLGQLAEQRATSADVKNYARRMVDDHTKANSELREIANDKNITIPTDLDSKQKSEYERMSKLSGANFDRAYMERVEKHHRKDVAYFEKQANEGTDNDVKQWAQRTLPTLRKHLEMAHQVSGHTGDVEHTSERRSEKRTTDRHQSDTDKNDQ